MKLQALGLAAALVLTLTPSAHAQDYDFFKEKAIKIIEKTGVHVSTSFADPLDKASAEKDGSWGLSVGLAPGVRNGWRTPFGIAWFTEQLRNPSNHVVFSELRSRPILAGIGYSWHFGQLSTGAQLQAGWAFNSLKTDGDPAVSFAPQGGVLAVDVHHAPVLRPQFKIEYFLTKKLTARSALSYMFEKPRVDIITPAGTISERWSASNVQLSVGLGFYPFRK
jgi:hypothetical protein